MTLTIRAVHSFASEGTSFYQVGSARAKRQAEDDRDGTQLQLGMRQMAKRHLRSSEVAHAIPLASLRSLAAKAKEQGRELGQCLESPCS